MPYATGERKIRTAGFTTKSVWRVGRNIIAAGRVSNACDAAEPAETNFERVQGSSVTPMDDIQGGRPENHLASVLVEAEIAAPGEIWAPTKPFLGVSNWSIFFGWHINQIRLFLCCPSGSNTRRRHVWICFAPLKNVSLKGM